MKGPGGKPGSPSPDSDSSEEDCAPPELRRRRRVIVAKYRASGRCKMDNNGKTIFPGEMFVGINAMRNNYIREIQDLWHQNPLPQSGYRTDAGKTATSEETAYLDRCTDPNVDPNVLAEEYEIPEHFRERFAKGISAARILNAETQERQGGPSSSVPTPKTRQEMMRFFGYSDEETGQQEGPVGVVTREQYAAMFGEAAAREADERHAAGLPPIEREVEVEPRGRENFEFKHPDGTSSVLKNYFVQNDAASFFPTVPGRSANPATTTTSTSASTTPTGSASNANRTGASCSSGSADSTSTNPNPDGTAATETKKAKPSKKTRDKLRARMQTWVTDMDGKGT